MAAGFEIDLNAAVELARLGRGWVCVYHQISHREEEQGSDDIFPVSVSCNEVDDSMTKKGVGTCISRKWE